MLKDRSEVTIWNEAIVPSNVRVHSIDRDFHIGKRGNKLTVEKCEIHATRVNELVATLN